jgi:hypothetical protein
MELRLNNAIAQSQKIVAAAAPAMASSVVQQEAKIAPEMERVMETIVEPEAAGDASVPSSPETEVIPETPEEGLPDDIEELLAGAAGSEAVPEADVVVESGVTPDGGTEAGAETAPEAGASGESGIAPEVDASGESGAAPGVDAEAGTEAAPEEKPPMPDLSDPNKKMSADDIAALFAAMT